MKRFLLCLLLAAGANAGTPEDVVRDFYAAYAANDTKSALAMLDQANINLTRPRNEIEGELWAKCVEVESLHLATTMTSPTTASVRATARIRATRRAGGAAEERVEVRTITLANIDNAWRIVNAPTDDDPIIRRITPPSVDADAVRKVLAEDESRLSPAFVRKLFRQARLIGTQRGGNIPDSRLIAIAGDVAAMIGDRVGQAMRLVDEAQIGRQPGADRRPLMRLVESALPVLEAEGDADDIARGRLTQATLLIDLDATREAENVLLQIVADPSLYENSGMVSDAFASIGTLRWERQDFAGAYAAFARCLSERERRDPTATVGFCEMSLGGILAEQNDPELALTHQLHALTRLEVSLTTRIQMQLGAASAYRLLGDRAKAADQIAKTIELTRPTPYKGLLAAALTIRAEMLVDEGKLAQAEEMLHEAVDDARAVNNFISEHEASVTLGKVYLMTNRPADALRIAADLAAFAARREVPGPELYASLLMAGRAHRVLGETEEARRSFEGAIEQVESMRGSLAGAERQRRLFFEPYSAAYSEIVDLLVTSGRVEDALLYAERAKGRVLLDVLHSGRDDDAELLSADDRAHHAELVRALNERNRQFAAARGRGEKAVADATAEVRAAEKALDAFDVVTSARNPRVRVARGEAPVVSMKDVASLLPDERAAFVEFVVHNTALDVFVVDRTHVVHRRIDVARETLEKRVTAFADALAAEDLGYRAEAQALYALLLGPIEGEIRAKSVLAIVPDGVLWRLPFGALVSGDGKFLVERSACFFVPSISVYREMMRRPRSVAPTSLLAFGNPTVGDDVRNTFHALHRGASLGALPEAEEEVRKIARLYGPSHSRVFIGRAADEERAKEEMPRSRVIHFATHGVLDDANPMYSELVLAPTAGSDGVLQAWEIMRLDLGADLVVLSACDTARGQVGAGEGLIGISWALFAGGSPSTVATLWKVGSRSAADLMVDFHRELLERQKSPGFAKAEALRAAQTRFIKAGKSHPFYWSAFVLVGAS